MFSPSKIHDSLLCLAVADAVGEPFEFKDKEDFTKKQILDYAKYSVLSETDDTQMTVFGFEGLHNGDVKHAYINWWKGQVGIESDSVFSSDPAMARVAAPGNTCLSSLYRLHNGMVNRNNSYGCGSVMRLLPFLTVSDDPEIVRKSMYESAEITHHHQNNRVAIDTLVDYLYYNKLPYRIESALNISELGQGWVATECVDMAIYSFINAGADFDRLLELSIHHSGDSDSVAAVAGMIYGLCYNPPEYITRLNCQAALSKCKEFIK
jgi:ADP-ribosylglycohydrolase